MVYQLFIKLLVVLAVLLIDPAAAAQEAKASPTTTQRPQSAQPKAPARTADGKAEKAPAVPAISLQEKEQIFQSTLDSVLSSAFQIEPVEYGIIVQIEGAALLWEKDRARANEVLANAWSRLQELMGDKGNSRLPKFGEKLSDADRARLRSG